MKKTEKDESPKKIDDNRPDLAQIWSVLCKNLKPENKVGTQDRQNEIGEKIWLKRLVRSSLSAPVCWPEISKDNFGFVLIKHDEETFEDFVKAKFRDLDNRVVNLSVDVERVRRIQASVSDFERRLEKLECENLSLNWQLQNTKEYIDLKLHRVFPIRIYLSQYYPELEILGNMQLLAETLDCKIIWEAEPQIHSFWDMLFGKTNKPEIGTAILDRLEKMEEAMTLKYLDKPQAEITKETVEAFKLINDSLKDTPEGVIQIGSILYIKVLGEDGKSRVFSKTLSREQLILIEENPEILRIPASILENLSVTNNKTKTAKTLLLKNKSDRI
ncbi:MAG: hypothetical protein CVV41_22370 [Candidatus Riflebacteria bacterium HGW-Riflebacteria-1]|jgi:prefoldin subunit 5|nr:MAG: hypothetical protein CVV41_22370 [Candidatus Riflebacteria bacterium HGW-Riflebacteria-1]